MKVVFRADASREIGSGHVMRCLSLATHLRLGGHRACFILGRAEGNMSEFVRAHGHDVYVLSNSIAGAEACEATDVAECARIVNAWDSEIDWLIADHYQIGGSWQLAIQEACDGIRRLAVVDDLANRTHACDLLIDQTLGREAGAYRARVPQRCRLLLGSQYALLRPQFEANRPRALERRASTGAIRRILINFGGVDPQNATWAVLSALAQWGEALQLSVVLGETSPHVATVSSLVARLNRTTPLSVSLTVGARSMAELMVENDVAIGAGGTTSWERCCLGLPSLVFSIADNQDVITESLHAHGAAVSCGGVHAVREKPENLLEPLVTLKDDVGRWRRMSDRAAAVTDGAGARRVSEALAQSQGIKVGR